MSELKILLIDDDPSINFLNRLVIERAEVSAEVVERSEAKIAIDQIAAKELQPDIILLDINMPIMNGWEFADQYEKLPEELKKSKIIVLTSSINPSDKEMASSKPVVTGFYSKPLTIDSVKEIIQL